MVELKDYLQDGAGSQERGVLAYLQNMTIEESYSREQSRYTAKIMVSRWDNGREQGYVVSMRSEDYENQLNIAFFEHRNSDNIHAVRWEQVSETGLTINTANFGDIYKNKFDTSYSVNYGEVVKMSDWIENEFIKFWKQSQQ